MVNKKSYAKKLTKMNWKVDMLSRIAWLMVLLSTIYMA